MYMRHGRDVGMKRYSFFSAYLPSTFDIELVQVEAHVLADASLADTRSTGSPVSSGRAYAVTDGKPSNPQKFWDGVLTGLGEFFEEECAEKLGYDGAGEAVRFKDCNHNRRWKCKETPAICGRRTPRHTLSKACFQER